MAEATMTLIGLYNYDNALFSDMIVPDQVDKNTLINAILLKAGDFEVMYPSPFTMRTAIGITSRKWEMTFSKWAKAVNLTYDPIYNYDRYEEWTDNETENESIDDKRSGTETSSAKGDTNTYVNTFDNNRLTQDGQSTSTQSGSATTTDNANTNRNNETSGKRSGHLYGNIGVTTSQQMLQSELEIDYWNLYDHIADIYVRELCIPVY